MEHKPLVHSKMFWVNLLTFLVGVLTLVNQQFVGYLTPDMVGGLFAAVGALNVILRILTTSAINGVFEKD